MILKEVPSGKIEIVNNGSQMHLQFNCSCEDALPYCKGMCCAYRPNFNVDLEVKEMGQFQTLYHHHMPGRMFLDYIKANGHCYAHDSSNGQCTIHPDKPKLCHEWHCSPRGVGENLTRRANGWLLMPTIG